MKKSVFLIVVLFFMSVQLKAQLHITPEVGVSILKKSDMKATVSPRVGVGLDFFFADNKGLGLSTGLYFYQKKEAFYDGVVYTQGGEMLPLYSDRPVDRNDIDKLSLSFSDVRRSYLQLPILIKYKWELANDLSLSVAAGPYVAYGISGNYKRNTQEYDGGQKEVSFAKDEFNPYDLYVYHRCEVGISTMLALDINHWVVKMNYEANLNHRNLNKDNLISLGIGYRFHL